MNITHRQYRILSDHMAIYDFMLEIYDRTWKNGIPAPFLEYALLSSWMDKSYVHRNRIWFDGDKIVGFCFTENPVTDVYFSLHPGYEFLADEMAAYAREHMPRKEGGGQRFVLFEGQSAMMDAAARVGLRKTGGYDEMIFDFKNTLDYPLPEGFRFVIGHDIDVAKCCECCWKGFDHEAKEGPWDGEFEHGYHLLQAPHNDGGNDIVIESESGEYACYSGMWWVPENRLAYMEPLCTIPKYRGLGLASAALSEHYRRMKALGATHMTGGDNPFYAKIGYGSGILWTFWEMPQER